jgi:hypothetical protein
MADFAAWIVGAEPALPWQPVAFLAIYQANQANANDVTLEASPVAQAVRDLMKEHTSAWVGTATALLGELESIVNEKTTKQKSWPGSGQTLSNELRRLASNLEPVGITITFGLKVKGRRALRLERTEHEENEASQVSRASSSASEHGNARDAPDAQASSKVSQASHQVSLPDAGKLTHQRENADAEDTWDTWDTSMSTHSGEDVQQRSLRVCMDCGTTLPETINGHYCETHGGVPADDQISGEEEIL